jgi:hypothetical protein
MQREEKKMKTTSTVAAKWQRGVANSGQQVKDGVMAVRQAPGEKAAAAADLYLQKVQEAVQNQRYQQGCLSVSLSQWQKDMIEKGIQRMSTGATAAMPKFQKFLDFWLPICQQSSDAVAAMPSGTPSASRERMLKNFDILSANKYKGRRS